MKQNLMILCYDFDVSKIIANQLSEYFSMGVLDLIDLFNFDSIPRTLHDMIDLNGEEFVIKKLTKIANSECDYEGIIFVSPIKIISLCRENFSKFKENNLIVYLGIDSQNKNSVFENNKDSLLLNDPVTFKNDEEYIQKNLADICIDAYNDSMENVYLLVVENIKKFYNIV